MRILYDGTVYQEQAAGGVNRYFANLISRLPPTFTPVLMTCQRREINYPVHPRLRVHRFRRFRPVRVSLKFEKLYFGRIADADRYDLAHPTYYALLSQREIEEYRCPVVVTVWDMIHELFPDLDPAGRVAERKRRAVEAAEAVICISESTKKDLIERYRVPESKVTVTYLASEIDISHADGPEPVPARPYFLYVGSRASYKNFDGLLSAFAGAATAEPEFSLCVVGPPFTPAEEGKIAALKLNGRIEHVGYVGDDHLAKLYHRSIAFVYPSLYEGFGIPPLEAMACGTAVVASDRSSIPEVVGGAALLFDPLATAATDELADILLFLVRNPGEREPLIARGRERAQLFSWDKMAAQTIEVYRSVVGRRGGGGGDDRARPKGRRQPSPN